MTPEKWNNLMRTAIAGVLTSGYALGFQYFKKDIDNIRE